jgi:hypothetical protein
LLLFLGINGCSSPVKQLTREQMLNAAKREYTSVTKEQVFDSIEKIFRLIEPKNVGFIYEKENQVRVGLQASVFPMYLRFDWLIDVNEMDKRVTVQLAYDQTFGGVMVPLETGHGFAPDAFNLFFLRLDYFLGKSSKWYSCDLYESEHPDTTPLTPLCGLTEDNDPTTLSRKAEHVSVSAE